MIIGKMLNSDFFNRDTLQVAKELPGKNLVRNYAGNFFLVRIVEVEAYTGITDKACHSYNGKRTKRNEIMYGPAGSIYVYFIYGMYYLLNFVTREIDNPQAILLRAVEPLYGFEKMAENRYNKSHKSLNRKKIINLTNGPGKLTKALNIDKSLNGKNLFTDELYITDVGFEGKIYSSKRIGIDYAQEAMDYPYRFFIDSPYVSKKL